VTRATTSLFKANAVAASNAPILLFEGDFSGTILRLWNGIGDLAYNGQTYLGNGWMCELSGVQDTNSLDQPTMSLKLSGVPTDLLYMVMNAQQNAVGTFYLGFLSGGSIVADPYAFFVGRLDTITLTESPEEPTMKVDYVSRLVDIDKAKEYRYTPECQKLFDATDKGFDYVAPLADAKTVFWGPNAKEIQKRKDKDKKKSKTR